MALATTQKICRITAFICSPSYRSKVKAEHGWKWCYNAMLYLVRQNGPKEAIDLLVAKMRELGAASRTASTAYRYSGPRRRLDLSPKTVSSSPERVEAEDTLVLAD